MNALVIHIHLLEPLLIKKAAGGDPHSAVGYHYIPGSVLRGALIGRYLQDKQPGYKLATDSTARRLFFEGAVRYLNAYPLDEFQQRMLPTPRSWRVKKAEQDQPNEIYDFARLDNEERQKVCQPKPVSSPFCLVSGHTNVHWHAPERQINIHTYRRKRDRQTKHQDSVFQYDALAADQTFCALILADEAPDLELIRPLLHPPDLSIGGSHRAGYGRVEWHIADEAWPGEYTPADHHKGDPIIVTCLSDVLLRDSRTGAYSSQLITPPPAGAEAYTAQTLVGGFNRKWGLPLPQVQAIQAGSVFVYPDDEALLQQLREWEQAGVGERRAEGFGRLAINWQGEEKLTLESAPPAKMRPAPPEITNKAVNELATQISERILQARLDSKLAVTLSELELKNRRKIQNSQLSRLRLITRRALQHNETEPVKTHLEDLRETATRQFAAARVEGQPLKDWIIDLVDNPHEVWQKLDIVNEAGPAIGSVPAALDKSLAITYTLKLIDGLLYKAAKTKKEEAPDE